jgi:hypothetical protein
MKNLFTGYVWIVFVLMSSASAQASVSGCFFPFLPFWGHAAGYGYGYGYSRPAPVWPGYASVMRPVYHVSHSFAPVMGYSSGSFGYAVSSGSSGICCDPCSNCCGPSAPVVPAAAPRAPEPRDDRKPDSDTDRVRVFPGGRDEDRTRDRYESDPEPRDGFRRPGTRDRTRDPLDDTDRSRRTDDLLNDPVRRDDRDPAGSARDALDSGRRARDSDDRRLDDRDRDTEPRGGDGGSGLFEEDPPARDSGTDRNDPETRPGESRLDPLPPVGGESPDSGTGNPGTPGTGGAGDGLFPQPRGGARLPGAGKLSGTETRFSQKPVFPIAGASRSSLREVIQPARLAQRSVPSTAAQLAARTQSQRKLRWIQLPQDVAQARQ